ncbi:MAG TPA: SAM-dependent methyltransferase [Candidatus Desulfobacillus sp.]|nr:SAM-dependent methyltransferase [Candidatus Desulfobacillus sp.]
MSLPAPDAAAAENSARLTAQIASEIEQAGGWLSFARYMELALYAPGLGYYSGGARKFGAAGDFVTAPELSPLFAEALARQAAPLLAASAPCLLEAGAGSGALALGLLRALERLGALPERYDILELSGELRARQQAALAEAPRLAARVRWLDHLPEHFSGVVVANELLDALPAHLVAWREDGIFERGVAKAEEGFAWSERPAQGALLAAAQELSASLQPPYLSEIGLAARAWVASWGRILRAGALLLIDYGFPRREYYHPQRDSGTLMCHYRHRAHGDPFWLPGLNDLTVHVDFTAIAEAGHDAGLEVLGYASQAQFLLNCGITRLLESLDETPGARAAQTAAVHKLISPAEMGELCKVLALGRGIVGPLAGFDQGDRTHAL